MLREAPLLLCWNFDSTPPKGLELSLGLQGRVSLDVWLLCAMFPNPVSIWNILLVELYDAWWLMDWKLFGRKWSWLNWVSIPVFAWSDWEKSRISSLRMARVSAKYRTEYLLNTSLHPARSFGQDICYLNYGLDVRGIVVRFTVEARNFSPQRTDRFWGPPRLL
jgi:hypothetical protein